MRHVSVVERRARSGVPRQQAVLREGRQFQFDVHGEVQRPRLSGNHLSEVDKVGENLKERNDAMATMIGQFSQYNTDTRKKQTRTRSVKQKESGEKVAAKRKSPSKAKIASSKEVSSKESSKTESPKLAARKSAKNKKANSTARTKSKARSKAASETFVSKPTHEQESRVSPWIGGVRSDHIPGYRIVKRFNTIKWFNDFPSEFDSEKAYNDVVGKGEFCDSPGEVKEKLMSLAVKLGANGFIDFYWEKHDRDFVIYKYEYDGVIDALFDNRSLKVEDRRSSYRWFCGTATPVVFEPIRKMQSDNRSNDTRSQGKYVPKKSQSSGQIKEQVRVTIPKYCVIDGSNIIRDKDHGGSVETFAACFFAVKDTGCQVQVFLDANEFHNLKDNGDTKGLKLLKKLIKDYPDSIQFVPAGSRADDFVLLDANNNSGHVISNDRYLEYTERYPWLNKNGGRRHTFMVTNGHLQIPDLGIDVMVDK